MNNHTGSGEPLVYISLYMYIWLFWIFIRLYFWSFRNTIVHCSYF